MNCPIYVSFRPTVLASSFCSPRAGGGAVDLGGPSVFQGGPKFEIKHKSRCLQKNQFLNWRLAPPGPFATALFFPHLTNMSIGGPGHLWPALCFPHRTNKIIKKTSLDLSCFLGFNFDGRPIKFQIHSCKGNIVEIYV